MTTQPSRNKRDDLRVTSQTEALRLADLIDKVPYRGTHEAAAELRRQHSEIERLKEALRRSNGLAEHFERNWYLRGDQIEELLEALTDFSDAMEILAMRHGWTVTTIAELLNPVGDTARAAIAKATGG